jgi:hypothetical protein
MPEPWRGVRDDALSQLTGVDGCIFCHATGSACPHLSRGARVRVCACDRPLRSGGSAREAPEAPVQSGLPCRLHRRGQDA